MTARERFDQLVKRRKKTEGYWVELAKDDVADEIYSIMEREEVTQAELARRLKTSRQYVTKMLHGGVNLTIESMVKIGFALGYRLRQDSFFEPFEEEHRNMWNLHGQASRTKLSPDMLKVLPFPETRGSYSTIPQLRDEAANYGDEEGDEVSQSGMECIAA